MRTTIWHARAQTPNKGRNNRDHKETVRQIITAGIETSGQMATIKIDQTPVTPTGAMRGRVTNQINRNEAGFEFFLQRAGIVSALLRRVQ